MKETFLFAFFYSPVERWAESNPWLPCDYILNLVGLAIGAPNISLTPCAWQIIEALIGETTCPE